MKEKEKERSKEREEGLQRRREKGEMRASVLLGLVLQCSSGPMLVQADLENSSGQGFFSGTCLFP